MINNCSSQCQFHPDPEQCPAERTHVYQQLGHKVTLMETQQPKWRMGPETLIQFHP